jgi:hypothetical protein
MDSAKRYESADVADAKVVFALEPVFVYPACADCRCPEE